jgi:hypothetical protein
VLLPRDQLNYTGITDADKLTEKTEAHKSADTEKKKAEQQSQHSTDTKKQISIEQLKEFLKQGKIQIP